MRVLIAFECSGVGRNAFRSLGHDAWSCDLKPAEDNSPFHIQGDALQAMWYAGPWDLMIAHPPCTDLSTSGARWFKEKGAEKRNAALRLFNYTLNAPIPKKCVENPMSIASSYIRKRDQEIQPWQHGHGEVKTTWLWLENLPLLKPSNIVAGREQLVWKMAPGPNRAADRARSYPGILKAMADQWA